MNTKILEFIDFDKVNTLLEGFNKSTGFVAGILDLQGRILSKSGWRKICLEFHRSNQETSHRCTISDTILSGKMARGEKYHFYKCLNGLIDVAVPVIINGEHIANLFSGQFLMEKPDSSFFQKQAIRYGFNEPAYMKALEEVPVITEEKVQTVMEFLLNMTQIISEMTFHKMELMQLNNALRISEERYRLVLENSMDAIILASFDGSILSVNEAACKMLQRTEEELIQLGRKGLVNLDDPRFAIFVEERDRTGKARGELEMIRKDGTKFPVELSASVFLDQSGKPLSSFTVHDITERKLTEKQLIIAKEKAEESDRLKTAFLQNMNHEIRTPMNAIMGFSGLLASNTYDTAKVQKFSEIIHQRCRDLLDIINDLLDISRIESGQLSVNFEEVDLGILFSELTEIFKEYQAKIEKEHLKLKMQPFSDQEKNRIITDPVKLKQILINLISNALKFTDEGVVNVGCMVENNDLMLYVSDSGSGIPLDKQDYIFERFSQLQNRPKMNIGGTGLGLPIVKALVNLLGGKIFVESEPGAGSTFSFSIPYQPAVPSPEFMKSEVIKEENLKGKTVLIVEDDPYNMEYLKEVLSGTNMNILEAVNGNQAVDISIIQMLDLILMDIRLPDINGYEAARLIWEQKPELKIIAQTAYASTEEKNKALDFGFVDYVSKPMKKEVLLEMIIRHIG